LAIPATPPMGQGNARARLQVACRMASMNRATRARRPWPRSRVAAAAPQAPVSRGTELLRESDCQ
jgi:hypothetical protein